MTKRLSEANRPDLAAHVAEEARALRARLGGDVPRVCLGLSGGMDSTVLLHLLVPLWRGKDIHLSAVHVHHGLSPNADAWREHCAALCSRAGIELRIAPVRIEREPGQSVEEEARRARLGVFAGIEADAIALAHHADDQAETVLLQLLRGAGPRGLSAMASLGRMSGRGADRPLLWRPLLAFPRSEIAGEARDRGLGWVDDESNLDCTLRRNFVRHRLMATLAEGFPAYAATLARAAELQAQCSRLLGELADLDLATANGARGLDCAALQALSMERLANALRRWLDLSGVRAPSARRLMALVTAVRQSSNDTRLRWEHESVCVRRERGTLLIEPREP